MNIVLTGATGFIGSHLRKELVAGNDVVAPVRQIPQGAGENVAWVQSDLANGERLSASLPGSIDAVIHLAQSKGYRHFPDEAADIFDVNVASTLALLEYARKSGAKTFIFASTASIYQQGREPLHEDAPLVPASFYARSKRMAEMLVESYAGFYRCIILRIFTVYGPGQAGMLIPGLIEKVRSGSPIQVQGKEGLTLSPVYVDDVNRAIRASLEQGTAPGLEIINVGGGEQLSIRRMGEAIGSVLGIAPQFEFTPGDEPGGWTADIARMGSVLGLSDLTTFEEGIGKTVS